MSCRYDWLQLMMHGYGKTPASLMGFDDHQLKPFYCADDIGMYHLIPKLAHTFSLSLDQAICFFYYGMLLLGFILGMIGFFKFYSGWMQRAVVTAGLLGICFISRMPDTYVAASAAAMALVPLSIYMLTKKSWGTLFYIWALCAGIIIGFAQYIRAFSAMPPLIFMVVLVLFTQTFKVRQKLIVGIILLLGCSLPAFYFSHIYNQHVAYVQQHLPNEPINLKTHVFWHNVYIGLGFLNNEYGIKYDDSVAAAKVASIDPSIIYCSREYEETLRTQVLKILKTDVGFIIKTLFAKLGIMLFFLLKYANIGLIAALFYRKPWYIELAFWASMAAGTVFGFLTVPVSLYLFSYISLAALYGVVSINYALQLGVMDSLMAQAKRQRRVFFFWQRL